MCVGRRSEDRSGSMRDEGDEEQFPPLEAQPPYHTAQNIQARDYGTYGKRILLPAPDHSKRP
ncbi:unnamed protein product [Musa acuminata var. zebrina]